MVLIEEFCDSSIRCCVCHKRSTVLATHNTEDRIQRVDMGSVSFALCRNCMRDAVHIFSEQLSLPQDDVSATVHKLVTELETSAAVEEHLAQSEGDAYMRGLKTGAASGMRIAKQMIQKSL